MRGTVRSVALVVVGAWLLGCAPRESAGPAAEEVLGEGVVARIGDRAIRRDEVASAARELRCTSAEALDAMLAFELLAREAEARGFGARAAVEDAVDRRIVQALLEERVEPAGRGPVDESRVAEGIEAIARRAGGAPIDEAAARAAVERRLRLERQRAALEELLRSLGHAVERPAIEIMPLLARIQPSGASP